MTDSTHTIVSADTPHPPNPTDRDAIDRGVGLRLYLLEYPDPTVEFEACRAPTPAQCVRPQRPYHVDVSVSVTTLRIGRMRTALREAVREGSAPPVAAALHWEDDSLVCNVAVADPFVSKEHVQLRRVRGGWQLDDLESRNGTFHDTTRVRSLLCAEPMCIRTAYSTWWVVPDGGRAFRVAGKVTPPLCAYLLVAHALGLGERGALGQPSMKDPQVARAMGVSDNSMRQWRRTFREHFGDAIPRELDRGDREYANRLRAFAREAFVNGCRCASDPAFRSLCRFPARGSGGAWSVLTWWIPPDCPRRPPEHPGEESYWASPDACTIVPSMPAPASG